MGIRYNPDRPEGLSFSHSNANDLEDILSCCDRTCGAAGVALFGVTAFAVIALSLAAAATDPEFAKRFASSPDDSCWEVCYTNSEGFSICSCV